VRRRHLKVVRGAHTVQRFEQLERLDAVARPVRDEQMEVLKEEPVLGQRSANPRLDNKQAQ